MFNFKQQTNKCWYFFEEGKFQFGKNFLQRESPTLTCILIKKLISYCIEIVICVTVEKVIVDKGRFKFS